MYVHKRIICTRCGEINFYCSPVKSDLCWIKLAGISMELDTSDATSVSGNTMLPEASVFTNIASITK